MKTYFIVNACILDSEPSIRDEQYKNGISKLIELTKEMENIQIIIVENNGGKQKYLEDYNNAICTTFYTNNNRHIETGNIGIKELIDVLNCIRRFDIGDDDFIVKMNGRYVLNDESEFIAALKNMGEETHCIIKYGSYDAPLTYRTGECISAIIGMRGKYAKQINIPRMEEKVENVWAAASLQIDEQNIVMLEKLGINVCPGGNDYFLV